MNNSAISSICPGTSRSAMPTIDSKDTIPQDIDVVMITGNNVSHPAMTACCAPNKVQLLDGCYLWCKIPGGDYYTNTGQRGAPKLETKSDIFRNISSCLDLNGFNQHEGEKGSVQGNIVSASLATGSRGSLSTLGLGIWALVVLGGVLMG
ncbi:hypothetical protein QBC37DRAFT_140818 [Rhypophila decipiens]|uniref:Uncharacterized protein n=1 Tax=Rhypophila decipiens TaxID=261697 RepID=A0AAN7B1B3_9PEZI|nr:hypothetical protein QBC37DRAFT_140818 [Rhypophila decipiens]